MRGFPRTEKNLATIRLPDPENNGYCGPFERSKVSQHLGFIARFPSGTDPRRSSRKNSLQYGKGSLLTKMHVWIKDTTRILSITVLSGLLQCFIYLDDVVVFGGTLQDTY